MKVYNPPAKLISLVSSALDELFERVKVRILGPKFGQPKDKSIVFKWKPQDSLAGLFASAAVEEHTQPDVKTLERLLGVAEHYLEAQRATTKAKVIKGVSAFLQDAWAQGVKTDVETVLGGTLFDVWRGVKSNLERIVNTEGTVMRNMGVLEGILKVNEDNDVDDPVVYFVVVRDEHLCLECKRLHLLDDGITPRLWRLSEVGNEYHKKGEPNPKMSGLHPNCRCSLTTLMLGWGFDDKGMVTYIGKDHDEFAKQRGIKKSEDLSKSTREGIINTWKLVEPIYQRNKQNWEEGKHPVLRAEARGQYELGRLTAPEEARLELAPLTVNMGNYGLRLMLNHNMNRLINTFEPQAEGGGGTCVWDDSEEGDQYHRTRLQSEWDILGIPKNTKKEHRPIYGALAFDDPNIKKGGDGFKDTLHNGGASGYGPVWLELKPHVGERMSLHEGDTFSGSQMNVFLNSLRSAPVLLRRGASYPHYIEAQIHGGVYFPDDVEAIHTNTSFGDLSGAAQMAGKRFNLPVYEHRLEPLSGDWVTTLLHDPRDEKTKTLHSSVRTKLLSDLNEHRKDLDVSDRANAAISELNRNQHDVRGHEFAVKAIRQKYSKAFPYLDENMRPIEAVASPVQPPQPKPRKVRLPGRGSVKSSSRALSKLTPKTK